MGGKAVSVRSKDDPELRAHRLCIDLVTGRTSREYVRAGFFDDRHCATIREGIRGGIFPRLLAHPFIPHIYLCLFGVWLSTLVIGNTLPSVY